MDGRFSPLLLFFSTQNFAGGLTRIDIFFGIGKVKQRRVAKSPWVIIRGLQKKAGKDKSFFKTCSGLKCPSKFP